MVLPTPATGPRSLRSLLSHPRAMSCDPARISPLRLPVPLSPTTGLPRPLPVPFVHPVPLTICRLYPLGTPVLPSPLRTKGVRSARGHPQDRLGPESPSHPGPPSHLKIRSASPDRLGPRCRVSAGGRLPGPRRTDNPVSSAVTRFSKNGGPTLFVHRGADAGCREKRSEDGDCPCSPGQPSRPAMFGAEVGGEVSLVSLKLILAGSLEVRGSFRFPDRVSQAALRCGHRSGHRYRPPVTCTVAVRIGPSTPKRFRVRNSRMFVPRSSCQRYSVPGRLRHAPPVART